MTLLDPKSRTIFSLTDKTEMSIILYKEHEETNYRTYLFAENNN